MANVPQVDTVMPDPWWDSHSPLYITQQVAPPPPPHPGNLLVQFVSVDPNCNTNCN